MFLFLEEINISFWSFQTIHLEVKNGLFNVVIISLFVGILMPLFGLRVSSKADILSPERNSNKKAFQ